MTSQKDPDHAVPPLNYLKHENGSRNLLVILGGALGAVFVAYLLLDPLAPAPMKVVNPAQTQAPGAASTPASK